VQEFYDKFEHRQMTVEVLDYLWGTAEHRATLVRYAESAEGYERFIRFAHTLVNDIAFQIEEAFKALTAAREWEQLLKSPVELAALEADDRSERERKYRSDRGTAGHWLAQARDQIELMSQLSSSIVHVWVSKHLRDHFCQAMGYFLDHLVGPKRSNLAVQNRAELQFDPLETLFRIMRTYANIAAAGPKAGSITTAPSADSAVAAGRGSEGAGAGAGAGDDELEDDDIFASAIVRDERSFKLSNFQEARRLLSRPDVMSRYVDASSVLDGVARLMARLQVVQAAAQDDADALGDIPDELQDPLMAELLSDPVLLPTSRNIMSREVIIRVLLDEERDPFNR